jgi:hypothetical protein
MKTETNILCLAAVSFAMCGPTFAQSASDPNEGLTISFDGGTNAGTLDWFGRTGRAYFILQTDDLTTDWNYAPVIETGNGLAISWGFSSTAEASFFRLKFTDQFMFDAWNEDLDGDGVSNMDELLQETDPFSAVDADSNGLADDWELFYSLTTATGDEETPPDGLTNQTESLIGSNPTAGFDSSSQLTIYTPN